MTTKVLLERTCELANTFLGELREGRVGSAAQYEALVQALGGPLAARPTEPLEVVEYLAAAAGGGLVASPGPRYFGFVIGGVLPAALAADWLASTWDQNGFSFVSSPAAAAVEEVARLWMTELLGLSPDMSMGIVTGGTMANFTGLAAARHALLARAGWNVEEQGLFGAPDFAVLTSEESHITIFAALQMLGLGRTRVTRVTTDDQGRMRPDALLEALSQIETPSLVCAQAGNVNTGAFDPLAKIAPIVHAAGGWLHVDGAFGTWAAASPTLRHLTNGAALADSLSVDGHKWLNVPYDCGFIFVRDREAHRAAMMLDASYYTPPRLPARANHHWVPEASRRARGFAVYAALRSLGRDGLAELVEHCARLARRMAERLSVAPDVRILNDVVLNQVLVRFERADGDADARTAAVIGRVQDDGTCWAGGTTWHGMHAMRLSVSNWSTTESDIDRSAEAILRCAALA
jgi:glutamate/tyrosine decarboxylase-like PLP-dependent enzyme